MKRRERPIPDYKARRLARELEREVAERIAAECDQHLWLIKQTLCATFPPIGRPSDAPQVH